MSDTKETTSDTKSKEPRSFSSSGPIQDFQCKIHQLSKNKDWINIKRSFIRAPQIFKHRLNIGSQFPEDLEFEKLHVIFLSISENVLALQLEITKYCDNVRDFMKSIINASGLLSEIFYNEMNDELELTSKGYRDLSLKFKGKWEDIKVKVDLNLELIVKFVKDPLVNVHCIDKNIKLYIKEREFAILDINKYTNNINILNDKIERNDRLSLKQEENLIRYQKGLELGQLKYERFNNRLKKELPKYFKLFNEFLKSITTTIYFLQMTNYYYFLDVNEISDSLFKLRSKEIEADNKTFFNSIAEKYKKNVQRAKDSLDSLEIIKPREQILLQMDDYLEDNYIQSPVKIDSSRNLDNISEAQSSIITAPEFCIAEYDFIAEEEGDLSFKKGQRIKILDRRNNEDWWKGEFNSKIGIFPKNYVLHTK